MERMPIKKYLKLIQVIRSKVINYNIPKILYSN
jgi:hypothetical protein